ncbi:ATP-binding protein [Massilia sp. W12]|uniref:ATP-binding protein n=1 Tax=Massilia sp. W12 TaxID=3126507 RepID=UPI0030CB7588
MHAAHDKKAPMESLNLLLILFSALVLAYTLLLSWFSWNEEKSGRITELRTIAEMGEKSVDTYFMQLLADMQQLADQWRSAGPLDQQRAHHDLQQYLKYRPELVNMTVFKPDGAILFTGKNPPGSVQRSLASEDSFREYQQNMESGPAFQIGRPIFGATSKVWLIPARLRVPGPDGKVDYILSANLPVSFLQQFWRDAPITARSALGLMRDDGFLISRFPTPKDKTEYEIYGKPRTGTLIRYLQKNNFPTSGVLDGESSLQGPSVFNIYRRLTHFPITLFVLTPQNDLWQAWWTKVRLSYLSCAILLAMAVLSYLLTRRRQRAWREQQARIEHMKAEFISVVSHELRTPITSIRGALGLLDGGAGGTMPEAAQKLVQIALRNSERLSHLVNDILDMERLMLGKITLQLEKMDLAKLLANAVEANTPYASKLGVAYQLTPSNTPCYVLADEQRLNQVLTNLLSNAAKFSPAGQSVEISLQAMRPTHWRIKVRDHGPGVPASFQEQIFSPFAQADSTNTRQSSGAGLGLHISKTLIERMGGQIGFDNCNDGGASFWIELPICKT